MAKALVLSLGRSGSLPIYAENIVNCFIGNNYDIIISKDRYLKKGVKNSIEIKTYNSKLSFLFFTFFYLPFKLVSFLPKIYNDYSTLYLPYQHFWDIPFIFIFKLLGKKVVFTVHDGILHAGEKNYITQNLTDYRIRKATELIFLTKYVQELVEKDKKIKKKSYIIPHPILENPFFELKKETLKTKNLLFFGRIDKYKGVEILMESAMKSEASFEMLRIAGKNLYDISYLKHKKIEVINKYLSEKEIGRLINWADILVLPYLEATQSGVISLGIYGELPMICTKVGGFSEQLEEDEAFWCEPNVESLSKTISQAFNNQEKCIAIKEKLKLKKKKLTWSKIAQMVESSLN